MKPGYKQTEVGVIPAEWDVKTFEKLFNFSGGYSASRDQLSSEGHCYLHYGDIHGATKTTVDVRADYQNIPKLNIPLTRVASKSLLEDGDIVFVDASEDDEGTSRHVVVVNKDKKPFISGLHTIVAKSKTDELVHEYRRYCFQTATIRQQFLFYAVGTKVSGISKTNIAKLKLPVPTLPEQRAIAMALSDVDGLLGGLDRLIAKKRDLKQAAMQQLLTGQTRLPGFHAEWEVKRLGELFNFSGGYSASRDQLSTEGHCYLHYGDIHGSTKTSIDTDADFQNIPKFDIALKRVSPASLLDDGDVVFVDASEDDAGTSKHVVVVNKGKKPFISGLHTIVAKSKTHELAHEYRRFCFQTPAIRQQFLFYSVGTKVSGISKSNIPKLTLSFPSVPEQTAIASVLTEMDGELAVLEQRREKTRALKQAMMQELLTGRTRLV
jgi:type I restriction enzyme S subunit